MWDLLHMRRELIHVILALTSRLCITRKLLTTADLGIFLGAFRAGRWPTILHAPKIAVYVGSSLSFETQPKPTGPNMPDFCWSVCWTEILTIQQQYNFFLNYKYFVVVEVHMKHPWCIFHFDKGILKYFFTILTIIQNIKWMALK